MGTRCNVIFRTEGGPDVFIYRHWDGYPAETGAHLARLARVANRRGWSDGELLAAILTARESSPRMGSSRRSPSYELTNGIHGDIEHVYTLQAGLVDNGHGYRVKRAWRIGHCAAPFVADRDRCIAEAEKKARAMARRKESTPEFFLASIVNPAIRDTAHRVRIHNRGKAPAACYAVPREIRV